MTQQLHGMAGDCLALSWLGNEWSCFMYYMLVHKMLPKLIWLCIRRTIYRPSVATASLCSTSRAEWLPGAISKLFLLTTCYYSSEFQWITTFLFLTVTSCCDFGANKHSTEDPKLLAYSLILRHGIHAISCKFWDIEVPQACWGLSKSSNSYFPGYSLLVLLNCSLHAVGCFYAETLYCLYVFYQVKVAPMWK